ncbi:hypothetical protein N7449_003069 [Penicillium cf. viridicatum]|uniref:sarcosine oxidasee (formaldehyde-forming) n=1 Tax=Penicillium cf. viridicatum TaxID=2972119 RepID=A0A9W9MW83_9EURO|nr:hypothetical protein N7449_003069 [Penicillium cf. viridicatum]
MEHFDVAVVGLGVLGSAAAYQAALRGKKVVAFEQFELGHVRGASHDTSRIVRTANASPQYVSLAKSAYRDWADLEKATDQKLLTITDGTGVVIETSAGRFHAAKVILATDAWTNKLLAPLGVHIPLTVMQEQVTYFKPTDEHAWEPSRFLVWIWGGDPCFYGFPSFGEPTIKVARDTSNNLMTPEQCTYVHSPQLLEQLCSFMGNSIPDKGRRPLRTVTCQYSITPDRQFIISPLEKYQDIIVGLGAAHAFKFAPAFGRALAELAIDGKSTEDLSKFGIPNNPTSASRL